MHHTAVHHRLPRAGIDAIDDASTALATIAAAMGRPLRAETILLILDGARRGRTIVVVSGTHDPDAVIEVVECITQGVDCEDIGAIVIGTVRPGTTAGPDDRDVDRWLELSEIASLAGVEVLEWFVIGRGVTCPRDRLGEPPRW